MAGTKVELAGGPRVSYPQRMANAPVLLRPHPSHPQTPGMRLAASVKLVSAREILAEFRYQAPESERLVVPKLKSAQPSRRDDLWQSTCFEVFLQPEDARPRYWEINFSPEGDWNAYVFSGYREGLRAEPEIQTIRREELRVEGGLVVCRFRFQLPPEISGTVHAGITAVIETQNGTKSYWAMAHEGPKPDFHLNKSFIHRLEIGTHP